MTGKSPTSILLELCAYYKITPQYDTVTQESVPNSTFLTSVSALNYKANGWGRSKANAKHNASQNLIDILAQNEQYKTILEQSANNSSTQDNFNAVGDLITFCLQNNVSKPEFRLLSETGLDHLKQFTFQCSVGQFQCNGVATTKKEAQRIAASKMMPLIKEKNQTDLNLSGNKTQNVDAIGALITFCTKYYNSEIPEYVEISVSGEDHRKEFQIACKLGNVQRIGIGASKKEAKQKAANEMLENLKSDMDESASESTLNESNDNVAWVIPIENLPSVEEVLAEYRRLRKLQAKPVTVGIRYRQNFFMNLPEKNRKQATQILTSKFTEYLSPKEVVNGALDALGLKYEVTFQHGHYIFELKDCSYDCVLASKTSNIYERVISYLKTMLGVAESA